MAQYDLRRHLRVMGAFFMGFIAGVSFIATMLPLGLSLVVDESSPLLYMALDRWTVPAALAWGVVTGGAAWFGNPRLSLLAVALCGAVSGGFASGSIPDASTTHVITGGIAGLVYGGGAGLLLGKVFQKKS